jgi:hypothetical protein
MAQRSALQEAVVRYMSQEMTENVYKMLYLVGNTAIQIFQ